MISYLEKIQVYKPKTDLEIGTHPKGMMISHNTLLSPKKKAFLVSECEVWQLVCKSWIPQNNKKIYIHQNNDKSELHKYIIKTLLFQIS